jgi:GNAT superfamily N-acetyltransferase
MTFVLESRPYGDPDVARMVAEVQQEYTVRYGGPDAAVIDPAEFAWPTGHFVVGLLDGEAVAMGGWRRHDEPVDGGVAAAEIKRMYVSVGARRRGFARQVLAELERTAAQSGIERLILNTGLEQPEALALYAACGYRAVDGFGHYTCAPKAVFLGRDL